MRVPHELLEVPILLGGRDSRRVVHSVGAGFLVGYPTPRQPRCGSTALVSTRRAVARALDEYGNVWIRLNREGRATDVEITAHWHHPEDPAVDAAAAPFYPSSTGWDVFPIPTDGFVTPASVTTRAVGPGDALVVPSLLAARPGAGRDRSIVRSGTLAGLPVEPPAQDAAGHELSAYLVELRCPQELCGCAVFVLPDARRLGSARAEGVAGRGYRLLGLIGGPYHQDGLALVTPAGELLALLQRREFVEFGRKVDRTRGRRASATPGSDTPEDAAGHGAQAGATSEFGRFEDLTRRLVQVPKAELDEQRRGDS